MKATQSKEQKFWCEQIAIYEREFRKWEDRSRKIIKRYKDERSESQSENGASRFNILWSNVQTLAPSLYAKPPIPNVDRRFEDDDKVGTTAARILERAVSYYVSDDIFDAVMKQAVLDRLLPGRGMAWVRYCPVFKEGQINQVTDDTVKGEESEEELYSEDVKVDYVHWADYGHTWGRTDEEVRGKWRKVYMSRDELKRRFKNGAKIPLDKEDKKDEERIGDTKKACVYEIWDKVKKEVIWLHKEMDEVLDRLDDPLRLKDFFPCPKALYSTLANDNLIPTPDYVQYQDQARELDDLTARISLITDAIKVAGVYDASAPAIERLLSEGVENKLIPVEQWALFGEKGGLKGVVDFLPLDQIVQALISLYEARDKVKQDLYEITGISDIIRGATDPNETLGAQQLKGQFASLRLDDKQGEVARFARDLVKIMAQIIAEHFDINTIKSVSAVKLLTQEEKQLLQAQMSQQAQPIPPGEQPPAPPPAVPDEMQELLDLPTWEEVEALLRDDTLRCFRISIETDSTIKQDQEAEKAQRTELIGAVTSYLQATAEIPLELQPLAAELLLFGVKGYKVSRELEASFETTIKKIKQKAQNPPPPQPNPEEQKVQIEAKKADAEIDIKKQELGLKGAELQLKAKEMQSNDQRETTKLKNEDRKNRLDAKTKVQPDVAMSDPDMNEGEIAPVSQTLKAMAQMMAQGFQQLGMQQAQSTQAILQAVTAPKKTRVIRDANGRIESGVTETSMQ